MWNGIMHRSIIKYIELISDNIGILDIIYREIRIYTIVDM